MLLETDRIILRQWNKNDLNLFAKMNSDPETMKYFPSTLSKKESDTMAKKCRALIDKNGWGFWAVQLKEDSKFLGFVGLNEPSNHFPFSPCVEIGWRILKNNWGRGYATEAAKKVLEYAFKDLSIDEVVSFAAAENMRSISVMKRIGLVNTGQNFKHPEFPSDDPLSKHVLYKITLTQWKKLHNLTTIR